MLKTTPSIYWGWGLEYYMGQACSVLTVETVYLCHLHVLYSFLHVQLLSLVLHVLHLCHIMYCLIIVIRLFGHSAASAQ